MNFRFSFFVLNFAFLLRIFDEIVSGFRDKFQKRRTCVAFSIKFAKTNQKIAENSEFCEKNSLFSKLFTSLLIGDSAGLRAGDPAGLRAARAAGDPAGLRSARTARAASRAAYVYSNFFASFYTKFPCIKTSTFF